MFEVFKKIWQLAYATPYRTPINCILHTSEIFQKNSELFSENEAKNWPISPTNLHKNAGKMSFVRNKIEFCNKIRVSAFLVKIEFPLKRTKK